MGGLMYYLEHEPNTMAPFLRGLIQRFLASRLSNPSSSVNHNASYTHLPAPDALEKLGLDKKGEAAETITPKYDLESIPGL